MSTLKFGFGAIAAYISGGLVERWGVRPVTALCAIFAGIALCLMLFVKTLTLFYLIGILLGISALGVTTAMKIFVSQWFSKRQGLAIGISLMGTSCAGVIVPYVTTVLAAELGWRLACAVMSLPIWLAALPLFLLKAKEISHSAKASVVTSADENALSFKDIRFSRAFITIVVISFLIGMVDHGMAAHLVIYFDRDAQLGAELAALGFSLMMIMSNIGKLGYGWAFDKFSLKGVAMCWFIVALGVLAAFPVSGLATLLLFAAVYGPTQGGMLISVPIFSKHCFGTKALARAIAVLTTFFMIGSAAGPALAGYIYDFAGSYDIPFAIFILSALAAGLLTLTLKPVYWLAANARGAKAELHLESGKASAA